MAFMSRNEAPAKATSYANPDAFARFESRLPQMLEELAALTDIESPSNSLEALGACARYLESLGSSLLGRRPRRFDIDGKTHLLWQFGEAPRIVLVGHYDTVHPLGTVMRFPFSVDGDIARGPGVCDMKGGVITALHALRDLRDELGDEALDGVALFVNADEEIGSPGSQSVISELGQTVKVAIGFENAGTDWQIKIERRGTSHYNVIAHGRAAHAGDHAEKGINAIRELSAQVPCIDAIADAQLGTSVTPTTIEGGTTYNTVPERASMWVDVRARNKEEQLRVDREIRKLVPLLTEAEIEVVGQIDQPPMPEESAMRLFELAERVGKDFGIDELKKMAVGGAADTCRFAAAGAEAIDGFGAVGGDDHSDREWIYASSMPRQAALAAGLIERLLTES